MRMCKPTRPCMQTAAAHKTTHISLGTPHTTMYAHKHAVTQHGAQPESICCRDQGSQCRHPAAAAAAAAAGQAAGQAASSSARPCAPLSAPPAAARCAWRGVRLLGQRMMCLDYVGAAQRCACCERLLALPNPPSSFAPNHAWRSCAKLDLTCARELVQEGARKRPRCAGGRV